MIVTCERTPRAIVSADVPNSHGALALLDHVDIDVRERMPGYDAAPIIVDGGSDRCPGQRGFEIPDMPWAWDVNTEVHDDGSEWVVERHLAVPCPHCGIIADHLTEPIDTPFEFTHQGLSKSHRLVLSDPEILDLIGDDLSGIQVDQLLRRDLPLDDLDRRQRRWAILLRGISGAAAGYSHVTEGAVALVGATAKTVIGVKAGSAVGLLWTYFNLAFDGVNAANAPVTVELVYATWATNAPGTNSTGTTERQEYGRVVTPDWTGGRNWTTEPTALTVIGEGSLTPNGGLVIYDDPLDTEPDCAAGEGFGIRLTAGVAVNVRAGQKVKHL